MEVSVGVSAEVFVRGYFLKRNHRTKVMDEQKPGLFGSCPRQKSKSLVYLVHFPRQKSKNLVYLVDFLTQMSKKVFSPVAGL